MTLYIHRDIRHEIESMVDHNKLADLCKEHKVEIYSIGPVDVQTMVVSLEADKSIVMVLRSLSDGPIVSWYDMSYIERLRAANPDTDMRIVYITESFLDPGCRESFTKEKVVVIEAVSDAANLFRRLQEEFPVVFGEAPEYVW